MICRCQAIGLSLLALLATLPAQAHALKPLPLELRPQSSAILPSLAVNPPLPRESRLAAPGRRAPQRFKHAAPTLSQQALQALIENEPEQQAAPSPGSTFRFRRQGSVGRVIGQEYKAMCDSVSRKLWDDPAGKRVRFDVAGKPGVAVEIPLR